MRDPREFRADLLAMADRFERHMERRFGAPAKLSADESERGQKHMPPVLGAIVAALTVFVHAAAGLYGFWWQLAAMTALSAGASFGLTAIMKAISGTPKFNQDVMANRPIVQQSDLPWSVIYGPGQVVPGGLLAFWRRGGTNSQDLDIVLITAGHQIGAFHEVHFGATNIPLDGSGNATGTYAGFFDVEFHTGDPADTTQPFPRLHTAYPSEWTDSHLWRGRAKAHLHFKLDPKIFPSGVPDPWFKVDGKLLTDPRDSSVSASGNIALIAYDWMRWEHGRNLTSTEVPAAYVNAAANICDEDVLTHDGVTTQKRYHGGGFIKLDSDPKEVLKQILSAMAGEHYQVGGEFRIYAGAWRAPTEPTFAEGDFRRPEITWASGVTRSERFNTVRGRYVGPATNWQPSDFPVVQDATALADDGDEEIAKQIDLPFTQDADTAQRIAWIFLRDGLQAGNGTVPLKLLALPVVVGDTIQMSFAAFSWVNKYLKITPHSSFAVDQLTKGRVGFGIDLVVKETDPSVYDFTVADLNAAVVGEISTVGSLIVVQPVTDLHLVSGDATALTQSDGSRITRISATWTAPADQLVLAGGHIQVQYKQSADVTWTDLPLLDGAATQAYIVPVSDGVSYDVQVRAVNLRGAVSAWVASTGHIASQGSAASGSGVARPTAFTDTSTLVTLSPANVYDTDQDTAATVRGGNVSGSKFGDTTWSGMPAVGGMATAKLTIKSELQVDGTPPTATTKYSLDNGATWTNLYSQNTARALTSDVITLLPAQDLTKILVNVHVNGTSNPLNSALVDLYDVRVEYTL